MKLYRNIPHIHRIKGLITGQKNVQTVLKSQNQRALQAPKHFTRNITQ